jgi:exopolyphosphatase / guanosine-5'-triphosphate,3'-diphosphate pyrophosphatase
VQGRGSDSGPGLRLGCIDIGSNTTRLLVADSDRGRLQWVHQERSFTRLGHELGRRGAIGPAKIAEVVAVVRDQHVSARMHGAAEVRAVATEAVRSAANGDELCAAIRRATGLTVEVLSSREEARLAFVGVAGTLLEAPAGELGVVDVGGGSSELVVGVPPDRVRWWASVPIGSGELTPPRLRADPPTGKELAVAREQIAAELGRLEVPRPTLAVAVGGSATSLSRLAGGMLDGAALERTLALLAGERSLEIARRFAIDPVRARLLPAGLLILEGVARAFRSPLLIGEGGIREGVLLEASAT